MIQKRKSSTIKNKKAIDGKTDFASPWPKKEKKAVKNELYVETGKKIANLRKGQGLSQKNLAKKLGVSQQLISRIEKGRQNISLATLKKIAESLECRVRVELAARITRERRL